MYGSTEAGLVAWMPIDEATQLSAGALLAGRPPPDVEFLIDHPGPDGVGEIVVRSRFLAIGYWDEPELTAEKFGVDPADPALRTFRTGDLGRMRPDGLLELRGRADARVKVRGYGVDLSEVEREVAALEGVGEAVVVLERSHPRRPRLVAYITTSDGSRPTPTVLRRGLLERLPPYSVPASFVVLDAFPHTARGKIDRRALPPPPEDRPALPQPWVGPRDELEAALIGVWERVLRVRPVGIHDNFFSDLGGDSLLVTDAAMVASDALRRDIPFALFMECPTVAGAAEALRRGSSPTLSELVPLQPDGPEPPLFLVPGGRGEAIQFARLASGLGPDRPVFSFQLRGARARRALGSVTRTASRYASLLRAARSGGPYAIGGYSFGGVVAFEMARRLQSEGAPPEVLLLIDAPAPGAGRPMPRPPFNARTWLRRRVLLAPFLFTDRPVPNRWRAKYPFERVAQAMSAYRPAGRYAGRVVVVRSERSLGDGPDLGWGALVDGALEVIDVPGDHRSMLQAPHVRVLAEKLRAALSPPVDTTPVVSSAQPAP